MKYSFFLFIFLFPFCSVAATITSNQSGDWYDSMTWDCGCIPTTTDTVVVNHQVTLASSIVLSSLIIDASGELDATNLLTIVFVGDLSANGEAELPNVTLHAIGLDEMQTIEGNWSVRELIVTNSANLSLMGTLEVSANVRIDQSTLSVEPEGVLLLTENASGRATVIRRNAGHVNGLITRQIILPATPNRNVPFIQQIFTTGLAGVTAAEFVVDIPTWGFQGADSPNGFANIGYWSAGAPANYQTIQFATDTLPVWEGIYLVMPPTGESYTITFSGTLPPDDISMSIAGDSFVALFGNATNANADLQALTSQFQGAPKSLACWNTKTLQFDHFIDGISTNGMSSTLQPNSTCQFIPDSSDLTLMFDNENSMVNGAIASSLTPEEGKAIFSVSCASGFRDEVVVTRKNNANDAYLGSEDAMNTSSLYAACDLFLRDSTGNRTGISQIAFDSGDLVSFDLVLGANRPIDGSYEVRCELLDWCDGEVIFQSSNNECLLLSEGQFIDSIQLSSTANHVVTIGKVLFATSLAQIPCANLVDEFDSTCDCEGNVLDECGVCGGGGIEEGTCDCEGNTLDAIGVCGGDCMIDQNCNGICDVEELESQSCGAKCCGQGTVWDEETQTCVVAFPADLNFDGCVQLIDLLDFLTVYGSCND